MNSKTILLIEDNESDVDLTKRALERGHILNQLVVVEDGQDALDYLNKAETLPTLTLLDLNLPAFLAWRCSGGSARMRA